MEQEIYFIYEMFLRHKVELTIDNVFKLKSQARYNTDIDVVANIIVEHNKYSSVLFKRFNKFLYDLNDKIENFSITYGRGSKYGYMIRKVKTTINYLKYNAKILNSDYDD